jgi:hypothetical protein
MFATSGLTPSVSFKTTKMTGPANLNKCATSIALRISPSVQLTLLVEMSAVSLKEMA